MEGDGGLAGDTGTHVSKSRELAWRAGRLWLLGDARWVRFSGHGRYPFVGGEHPEDGATLLLGRWLGGGFLLLCCKSRVGCNNHGVVRGTIQICAARAVGVTQHRVISLSHLAVAKAL